jgi:hypothetical protein
MLLLWGLTCFSFCVGSAAGWCFFNKSYAPTRPPRQIDYGNALHEFSLMHGDWDSARHVAHVLKFLLEEKLNVRTKLQAIKASDDILRHANGCTDAGGNLKVGQEGLCRNGSAFQDPPKRAWAAIEVWMTTQEHHRLASTLHYHGNMGYRSVSALYTQTKALDEGKAGGLMLRWWEAYQLGQNPPASKYFSTVDQVDKAIRAMAPTEYSKEICQQKDGCKAGSVRPLCDAHIDDSHDEYVAMAKVRNPAIGSCEDGWWYSPACSADKTKCIPVILAEFHWNMVDFCQMAKLQNLPFAITWLGWYGEAEAVLKLSASHKFLYYWWQPDDTFLRLTGTEQPQQIVFDDKELKSSQYQSTAKVMWPGLRKTHNAAHHLIQAASFAYSDLMAMMVESAAGAEDKTSACDWLKANEAVWKPWLPAKELVKAKVVEVLGAEDVSNKKTFKVTSFFWMFVPFAVACGIVAIVYCGDAPDLSKSAEKGGKYD